ncbi:D-inositol 3-phosphate glycosyltransferase [Frondihabitans sp. 762G35]|uniref:glycosyltransferase family 4 protein n=1 Tax=Frondihabitans sp. 762G35 TaxID=1446794 RepID=UPI000D1FFAC3|nr:glycosyltransferase family 4 protein [Frondihabitans sp. 762G35]ARC57762.1 D-inositol 3-phosphate glycosyltransferase [Frondihabitans sp. 762G35]
MSTQVPDVGERCRIDRHEPTAEPLRIVTATDVLAPVGGVEVCVFEDTTALVGRGHRVELLYTESGIQRGDLEMLGVSLTGPVRFRFEPRRALRHLASFVRSARTVRRLRADVLWLNRPENVIWAQVVSRIAGIPLVIHLHHAPNYRLEKLLTTGVSHFMAVSEHMKTVWVAAGIPADRVTVVHNAVPLDKYPVATPGDRRAARRLLDLPEKAKVGLYFGRISRAKGVLSVVEAWRSLGFAPGEGVLVIAGDDVVDDAELQSALDVLDEGTVLRLPNQNDVVPLLHAADVVMAPSWEEEAFGRVLVESMSAGVPVIGATVGGMVEVLTGDLRRFLVPPRDSAALAVALRGVLDWRVTEPDLGAKLRQHVETHFPHGAHLDAIARVLEAHRSRRRLVGRVRRPGVVDR